MDAVRVKICGLSTPEAVDAAVAAGAGYVGFVFYAPSPRNVAPARAAALAARVPAGVAKVALVVDADDDALDAVVGAVPMDMIQLHGGESPARAAAVRARHGLPVMKAVGLQGRGDLSALDRWTGAADQVLVDAKPAPGAALPGGNGLSFDWTLLADRRWFGPWMLAGGLDAGNVREAVRRTRARQVDVSSGVERAPGEKDGAAIAAFCAAARGAGAPLAPVPDLS